MWTTKLISLRSTHQNIHERMRFRENHIVLLLTEIERVCTRGNGLNFSIIETVTETAKQMHLRYKQKSFHNEKNKGFENSRS